MKAEWQGILANERQEIAKDGGDKDERKSTCPKCFGGRRTVHCGVIFVRGGG